MWSMMQMAERLIDIYLLPEQLLLDEIRIYS
jgi:hypothetical protein